MLRDCSIWEYSCHFQSLKKMLGKYSIVFCSTSSLSLTCIIATAAQLLVKLQLGLSQGETGLLVVPKELLHFWIDAGSKVFATTQQHDHHSTSKKIENCIHIPGARSHLRAFQHSNGNSDMAAQQ